ncbi:MAG: tol-pal system YbgF family protein [Myxococcota bacterium]|nr:hypothetical protein [Myxococcota bacterium]
MKSPPRGAIPATARRLVAVALVSALLSANAHAAAPRPVEDEATRTARARFKAAETSFALGRFKEALDGYAKAYEAKPMPALLFNIGQCHFELGDHERAIFFYELSLGNDLDAKQRALVKQRLHQARTAQAAAEDKRIRADGAERQHEQLAMRLQEHSRVAAAKQAELDVERLRMSAPPPPTPIYAKWWFWAAAGTVVAVAATSVILATRDAATVPPRGDLQTIDTRTTP